MNLNIVPEKLRGSSGTMVDFALETLFWRIVTEKGKYLCYGNLITPVADIIDHRYIRRKKTIFTTNLVPAELCSRYGERIADRMNEDYAFIMYNNHPSYR